MRRLHNLLHEIISVRGRAVGVRFPRVALLALLGGLLIAPTRTSAAPDPALKQCKKSCNSAKKLCLSQAHEHLQTLLGDCTGSGSEKRQCRRNAKDSAKSDR